MMSAQWSSLDYKHLPLSCAKAALKVLIYQEKMRDLATHFKVFPSIISIIGLLILFNPGQVLHIFFLNTRASLSLTAAYIVRNNYIVFFPNTRLGVFWYYVNSSRLMSQTVDGQPNVKTWHFVRHSSCFTCPPCIQESRNNDTHFICHSFFNKNLAVRFCQWVVWPNNHQQLHLQRQLDGLLFFAAASPPLASLPPGNFQKILESATSLFL